MKRKPILGLLGMAVLLFMAQFDEAPKPESATPSADLCVVINWSGHDTGSGLAGVYLYYRCNGGEPTRYGDLYTSSPILFCAPQPGLYELWTVGVDNVGNVEAPPEYPDARITLPVGPTAARNWRRYG